MSIVLKHQVEASEQAADEIERELEHKKISLCYEVQSLLKILVGNVKNIHESLESWHAALLRREVDFDLNVAREFENLYRRIERTFERAFHITQSVKAFAQTSIEGQDKFHMAWSELRGIVCFSLQKISIADAQAGRGEGRELSEFMNELRHQAHA